MSVPANNSSQSPPVFTRVQVSFLLFHAYVFFKYLSFCFKSFHTQLLIMVHKDFWGLAPLTSALSMHPTKSLNYLFPHKCTSSQTLLNLTHLPRVPFLPHPSTHTEENPLKENTCHSRTPVCSIPQGKWGLVASSRWSWGISRYTSWSYDRQTSSSRPILALISYHGEPEASNQALGNLRNSQKISMRPDTTWEVWALESGQIEQLLPQGCHSEW